MIYQDLSYYRVGSTDEPLQYVFPEVRYVGWLSSESSYTKGIVDEKSVAKLKEMLFLDIKNAEEKQRGTFDESKSIQIHQRYRRGRPAPCPFCNKVITIQPANLTYYRGKSEKVLGQNEICLPSLTEKEFYASPTLIYHYITEHSYQPPQEFLDALDAFDVDKPFNADKAQANLICLQVPTHEVDELHLKPIPDGKYPAG